MGVQSGTPETLGASEVTDTARGIARLTTAARTFLEGCPAVETITETPDMLEFKYDPKRVPEEVPDGVYFDLSASPF